jgi:hypothetical protein
MSDGHRVRKEAWTTFDEIAFVNRLHQTRNPVIRKRLMEGYLAGFARRVIWGPLNREAIQDALFTAMRDL